MAHLQVSGTVKPNPGFNAESDASILRKAMKGMGTDEKAIIDILGRRTNKERIEIKDMFKTCYGKDLIKELKSELGGKFEDIVVNMLLPPAEYDARSLHKAVEGIGTKESVLVEIMCSRNNTEIAAIKENYKRLYKTQLEKDLVGDTGGHFKRLMVSLCMGNRQENAVVDINKAKSDAKALYEAGEAKLGTDESRFNAILASQNYDQLRVVFHEYNQISKHTIEQVISNEFSGDIKNGMLAIAKCVQNTPLYFAEQLYNSMKGAGTSDQQLIRCVVTRCEIDMVQIKQEFQKKYGKTLESFIKDDASGDYKRMLIALVQ